MTNWCTSEFAELVRNANLNIRSKAWNDKKITAHHAIIPTRIKADFENLNEIEQKLYMLVSQAYLAQFYPPHECQSTKVTISFASEKFVGKGKTFIKLGWRTIYKNVVQKESEETETTLPPMIKGESVKYLFSKVLEKVTKPPAKFTQSTLLQAMKEIYRYVKNENLKTELKECAGIGTEATRAGIIEKLQTSGFLKLVGKNFESTEKSKMAVKILPEEIIYPDTTAIWEKNLEEVAKGKESFEKFYQNQIRGLNSLIEKAKILKITTSSNAVICPNCGKPMVKRKGKNGYFWGCSGLLANGRNLGRVGKA